MHFRLEFFVYSIFIFFDKKGPNPQIFSQNVCNTHLINFQLKTCYVTILTQCVTIEILIRIGNRNSSWPITCVTKIFKLQRFLKDN